MSSYWAGKSILIVGCGYVGESLASQITEAGGKVVGLRRTVKPNTAWQQESFDVLSAGAATRLRELTEQHQGFDALAFLASPDERSEAAYRRTYVDAVQAVLDGVGPGGAKRALVSTSTAVYGGNDDWVDEQTQTTTEGFTALAMVEAERLVTGAVGQAVEETATGFRLGGIYGPGRTRLIRAVREGRGLAPAEGVVFGNRIHRDDAAGAIAHLLSLTELLPAYVGVDHEPADMRLVQSWLAEQYGIDPQTLPPSTAARARSKKRCSSKRLRDAGYAFRYPTFREGYGSLIAAEA